jgi:hypothetical protein
MFIYLFIYLFKFIYLRSIIRLYKSTAPFEPDSPFAGYARARYKYVTRDETLKVYRIMNAPT